MRSDEPGKGYERATVRVLSAASMFGEALWAKLTARTAGREDIEDETVLLVCEDCTQGYIAALPGKQKVQG